MLRMGLHNPEALLRSGHGAARKSMAKSDGKTITVTSSRVQLPGSSSHVKAEARLQAFPLLQLFGPTFVLRPFHSSSLSGEHSRETHPRRLMGEAFPTFFSVSAEPFPTVFSATLVKTFCRRHLKPRVSECGPQRESVSSGDP